MASLMGLAAALIGGCAAPSVRFDDLAMAAGLERLRCDGAALPLVAYAKGPLDSGQALHVYLEGDGSPWIGGLPARDPTPRHPLALRLMTRDGGSALLIGRPCYHGSYGDTRCTPALWTSHRYSEEVVAAMAAALTSLAPFGRPLVLIGYSGGGVLAMLLADRLEGVTAVITIAANLDIDAWADQHGYQRLEGSVNPAQRPSLRSSVAQRHFVGSADRNVSPSLVQAFADRQVGARVHVVPGFDHACCWLDAWPELIAGP